MANVGTAASGMTLVGSGNGVSPTFVAIGTNSGLTNHGVVVAKGTGAFVATSPGTTGFVLTSNGASADPTFQSISLAEIWNDISGTTILAANSNYFVTGASTLTLPAGAAQGNKIKIIVDTASSVVITANTGQIIRLSTGVSTSGGTQTNSARGDAMTIVFRATGSAWIALDFVGSWTPA